MTEYYVATDAEGESRWYGRWAVGEVTEHPVSVAISPTQPWTYIPLVTEPTEALYGTAAPWRLFRVEPIGEAKATGKAVERAVLKARAVEELDPWRALGPNGRQVAAFLARLDNLEARPDIAPAWDAWNNGHPLTTGTVRFGAKLTVWDAVSRMVPGPLRFAARNCGTALVVADLLDPELYRALTEPVCETIGDAATWPVPDWSIRA